MTDRFATLATRAGSSILGFISHEPHALLTEEAARENGGRKALWIAWSYVQALGRAGEVDRCIEWANGAMAFASEHDPGPVWWAEMSTTLGENLARVGELGKAVEAYDTARRYWVNVTGSAGRADDADVGVAIEEMVRALERGEEQTLPARLDKEERAALLDAWRLEHAGRRYADVLSALVLICAAAGEVELARQAYAELAAWNEKRSGRDLEDPRARLRTSYEAAMSLGEVELAAGNVEESERRFADAVAVYYQNVWDANELLLLVRAMFNQANSWVRLGRYDEAIDVYRMIVGDFETYGDEEAVLRIRHAELLAQWKRDPTTPIFDDLRRLIRDYEDYAARNADMRNLNVQKQPIEPAYRLFLSLVARHADPPVEMIGDCLSVIAASRQPEALAGFRDAEGDDLQQLVDNKAAVLGSYLKGLPDTVVLFLESGVEELVLLAFEHRAAATGPVFAIDTGAAALPELLTEQYELYVEELEVIADGRAPTSAPVSAQLMEASEAVWRSLPATIRDMVARASTVLVSASPGGLDRLPLELFRTESGWLGQDKVIAHVPTLRALLELLCPNRLPHATDDTAYVFRAVDPPELGRLRAADDEARNGAAFAELIGLTPTVDTEASRQTLAAAFDAGHQLLHYVGHGLAGRWGEILPVTPESGLRVDALGQLRGDRTPTVILSACEVGRGRSLPGGDVKGFAVQLLHHGAPGVVASTQVVPDAAQPRIIEALYRGLAEAPLGGAILRQRAALEGAGLSPILWSLLTLFGDPNHTVSPLVAEHPTRTADLTDDWAAVLRRSIASGSEVEMDNCLALAENAWPKEAVDDLGEVQRWLAAAEQGGDGEVEARFADDEDAARTELCRRVAAYDLTGGASLRLRLAADRISRLTAPDSEPAGRAALDEAVYGLVMCSWLADSICWTRFATWMVDLAVSVYPLYQVMEVLEQASSNATILREAGDRYAELVSLVDHQASLYQGAHIFDVAKMNLGSIGADA